MAVKRNDHPSRRPDGLRPFSPAPGICDKRAAEGDGVGLKLFIPCFLDQGAPARWPGRGRPPGRAWALPGNTRRTRPAAASSPGPWEIQPRPGVSCAIFSGSLPGPEAILCPSASCTYMVRQGYPQLAEGPKEQRAVEALASRVLELSQWLAAGGRSPGPPGFDGCLVLHRSCKARQLGVLPGAAREVFPGWRGWSCWRCPLIIPAAASAAPSGCSTRSSPGIWARPTWRRCGHRRPGAGVPGLQLPPASTEAWGRPALGHLEFFHLAEMLMRNS